MTGYLLALAGTAMFSSKAIFVKLAYVENPDALLVLTWRMIFSLPFFAAVCIHALVRRRRAHLAPVGAPMIVRILMLGVFGYLAMILDFEGLIHVSAGLERLVLFTYPVFLILIAAAFFGARITAGNLLAAGVSYAGLALVFVADIPDGGSNVPLGTLLVLGSALSFAIYQLWATGMIAHVGSVLFTALALTGTSLACLAHFFILRNAAELAVSPRYLVLAALTGILATVVPSFMINAGMGRIGAQSTAMISMVSPLFTIYLAVLILNESFTLIDGLGTALVVGGMGYDAWLGLRRRPSQAIDS
ncbi:MAG: DMT family transporter [Rhizobiales bacterium]|nr:DMT family transporter [Hyphomicrobiales bacterium]